MSRSYSKSYASTRVSMSEREMKQRAERRAFKMRNAESANAELLDRRFDYQQSDIYEMLNMQQSTFYSE